MYIRKLTAELTMMKVLSVTITEKKLALSGWLSTVETKTFKSSERLSAARDNPVCVEGPIRFFVEQSVEACNAFLNEAGTQLLGCVRRVRLNAYSVYQFPFPYTQGHIIAVGTADLEVQGAFIKKGANGVLLFTVHHCTRRRKGTPLQQRARMVIPRCGAINSALFTFFCYFFGFSSVPT